MRFGPDKEFFQCSNRKNIIKITLIFLFSAGIIIICLFLGRYPKFGFMPVNLLFTNQLARVVFFESRMPRLIAAIFLGAIMGASGNAFQMVFANPLAEPGFLGVTHGAALGAAISLVAGINNDALIALFAFIMAIIGLGASVKLARLFSFGGWILRMALAGIAVSATLSAGMAMVKYTADPLNQLPDIAYWTMGSLAGANWPKTTFMIVPSIIVLFVLLGYSWRITALSMDEHVSESIGMRTRFERALILGTASAGVASVVAVAGTVTWIGLVVPHVARKISGSDARYSIPVSMIVGAVFTVICDTFARIAFPGEIPLGAVTAFLGAIVFVTIFSRQTQARQT